MSPKSAALRRSVRSTGTVEQRAAPGLPGFLGARLCCVGRAAAEAFDHGGKTDILIRYEGKNLMVCECKFWNGPEGFAKTIDQLFGYTGWRDTKLAIVMFVSQKGLTEIVDKAKQSLGARAQFSSWQTAASDTELRSTMRWPGDDERRCDLNVFLGHTPKKSQLDSDGTGRAETGTSRKSP